MSSTSGPYGLTPAGDQSGQPRPSRMRDFVVSGYATNIFYGQPFYVDATTGRMVACTLSSDVIYGVFAGCAYTPSGGSPTFSPFWPAGTVIDSSNDFYAYYWPAWNPNTRWVVQADGSVSQAGMASQFNLSNLTAGNTTTGLSACTVNATPVAAGARGQVCLTEFSAGINSVIGDAFTDLIVAITNVQTILSSPTSIG